MESPIPIIISVGSGFFAGVLLGYFIKKIIKILMFFAGCIVALLLYLQQQQIISVDIQKLEHSSAFILNAVISSFNNITQVGGIDPLGVPLLGGMSAGFVIGLMKG